MVTQTLYIQNQFEGGLKEYLATEGEEYLAEAYELGRQSLYKGLGELDIITLYHNALYEINKSGTLLDSKEKLNRASAYLAEWLAPFEVRLRSYRDLIDELNEKNRQLENEIENRKQIEADLQVSKRHFQSLIENALDIITVLAYDGTIRYGSPSIERVLGYSQDELLGNDAFEYVHPDDIPNVRRLFRVAINMPERVGIEEFRIKHKNGEWIYLESIAKNVQGSTLGSVIIVNSRDVTDRKKTVQKLEESRKKLSEAQRIARVGSWEWVMGEGEGELRWSKEMCRIHGIEPGEFNRRYEMFFTHVHPDEQEHVQEYIGGALKSKQPFKFEDRIIRPDGKERILLNQGRVVTDEENNVIKMVGTSQDITELKQKEQQVREYSELLRKLSARIERAREEERIRIAREIHDELGQMLTVLKMDISLVSSEIINNIPTHAKDSIRSQMRKVVDRINIIIKSVQRITTALRPEVLDDLGLKDAIEWQAQEFGKRTGLQINFGANVTDVNILGDEQSTTLFRIFQETLTNVIRHANASKVDIELKKEQDVIYLIVKDDGIGITREELNDPTSLGIIGMRERTLLLGGDVGIEGEQGKGTKVILKIPLRRDK